MNDKEIERTYEMIKEYYKKYLRDKGVILPKLKNSNNEFTKDALVLVYLAQGYPNTKVISKTELTDFIRNFDPNVNDVQQARHLAAQKGWNILSGSRGNSYGEIKAGHYKLVSLEEPYKGFKRQKREKLEESDWEEIKKKYGYRCATCGSKEGEPHFHWPKRITRLQRGHIDPNKSLTFKNTIPQCEVCNRADRNNWIYDEKGRVIALANPQVIKRSPAEVRREVYKILQKEFGKGISDEE